MGKDEVKRERETGMVQWCFKGRILNRPLLTSLPKGLPKTIEDAITLTRLLGYRFLGLDALCIVQDDPLEEKVLHLTNLKAIYSCASITIAAAAGSHANHGLQGISVPRKCLPYLKEPKGLKSDIAV